MCVVSELTMTSTVSHTVKGQRWIFQQTSETPVTARSRLRSADHGGYRCHTCTAHSIWLAQFPHVRTNNLEQSSKTPTKLQQA